MSPKYIPLGLEQLSDVVPLGSITVERAAAIVEDFKRNYPVLSRYVAECKRRRRSGGEA